MTQAIQTKVCQQCGRELPIDDFYVAKNNKDGHRNKCKHCYIENNQRREMNDPEHKTKHRIQLHEKPKPVKSERRKEYERQYREAHRAKLNENTRKSIERKREGKPKQTPGPKTGEIQYKHVLQYPDRTCRRCGSWPCFDGIEHMSSDFAAEGCHGWHEKEQTSKTINS